MNSNLIRSAVLTLFGFFLLAGCSQQSDTPEERDSDAPEIAGKKMTVDIDKMVEETIQSGETIPAADWVKRYPKSAAGEDEEGQPILLAPLVARLNEAGAQKILIEFAKIGQGEFLVAMIVVLPKDTAARQKIFAMEPELSLLCQQTQVTDRGQKYLHYSFD